MTVGLLTVAHSTTTKIVDATFRFVMRALKPIDVLRMLEHSYKMQTN